MGTSQRVIRRRVHQRERVSIYGKLIFISGQPYTVPCLITDMSPGGACIEFEGASNLPDEVLLFEADNQNIYECVVRWRKDNTVGLSLVDLCPKAVRRALMEDETLGLLEGVKLPNVEEALQHNRL